MANDPHNLESIPAGTPVVALDGELLGRVREAYPNYLLVDQQGHEDLDVPAHAVHGMVNGQVQLTINRSALTEVDHEETVHHQLNEDAE